MLGSAGKSVERRSAGHGILVKGGFIANQARSIQTFVNKLKRKIRLEEHLLLICDSYVLFVSIEKILSECGIPFHHVKSVENETLAPDSVSKVKLAIYACKNFGEIELEDITEAMRKLAGVPVLSISLSSEDTCELEAIRRGVRGSIKNESYFGKIPEAISAVVSGELWFSRTIIQRVVDLYRMNVNVDGTSGQALLTSRQMEVLRCLVNNLSNREIAEALNISQATVIRHVYNIYRRLGVHNRLEALTYALRQGLIVID